ncbi:hypothetical protein QQF64_026131 [Cirrhinus molitorella]|uniref:Uncharacterized protein n=1 Tax=Cirrhinus molitorella TaxID=172907 RepID=A0ABR3NS06_9TELE
MTIRKSHTPVPETESTDFQLMKSTCIRAQDKTTTAVIPVHITNSQDHKTKDLIPDPGETEVSWIAGSLFREIMLKSAVFVAPTVILLQIICERRAERKKQHREKI